MKKLFFLLAFLTLIIYSCSETDPGTEPIPDEVQLDNPFASSSKLIPGKYIVLLHEGTLKENLPSRTDLQAIVKGQAIQPRKLYENTVLRLKDRLTGEFKFGIDPSKIENVYGYALDGFVAHLTANEVARLKNDPRVKEVIQDQLVTLAPPPGKGPGSGGGGDPEPTGQEVPWGINRVGGNADGSGKTAWIIDSGIDLDHPDLNVDVARSISFTGDNNPDDGNGHGTHVAGTVAAIDNNIGVVGVAAGANVVALKVLGNDGSGDFSWTVSALDYVAAFGSVGDAVNMSLGPNSRFIEPVTDAATLSLASAGINIAIAAGNSYDDSAFYSPARNNGSNIYTVSALAEGDVFVYFSNYGSPVDFIAPGYQVRSTWPGGGYNTISGTSMASPHVCGILLLGNVGSDGTASDGYWEVKGSSATGNYSATDSFRRSVFRPDPDGVSEPIAHR